MNHFLQNITVLVTKLTYKCFEEVFIDGFTLSNYFYHYHRLSGEEPQHVREGFK